MTRPTSVFATLVAAAAGAIGWQLWNVHRWPTTGTVGGYTLVDLAALCNTKVDPKLAGGGIPQVLRNLDGRLVAVDGFVPNLEASAIREFRVFNGDRGIDGGFLEPSARVVCIVPAGRTVSSPGMDKRIRVFGTLHVGIHRDDDGQIDSAYRLDVDRLEPAP
jgi:hypothetical protein